MQKYWRRKEEVDKESETGSLNASKEGNSRQVGGQDDRPEESIHKCVKGLVFS